MKIDCSWVGARQPPVGSLWSPGMWSMMKNVEGLPLKESLASASAFAFLASSASYAAVFFYFFEATPKSIGASSSSSMMARGSFGLNTLAEAAPPNGFDVAAAANGLLPAALANGFGAPPADASTGATGAG